MDVGTAAWKWILFIFVTYFPLYVCKLNEVATPSGTLIGRISNVVVDGDIKLIREFLGVPYAQPPVSELRFRKPEKLGRFKTAFNATSFGPICPQGGLKLVPLDNFVISEDCLSLNIFAPQTLNGNASFAVMIYIHGGAFVTGASPFYVSDVLSAHGDVIVVTFNYRVSIFGFLSTNDDVAPGNFGLWDQHLAIKWVHENIVSFGGDPNRVTIFGQSAGAISVIYQAMYPGNAGIFQRMIAESGTPVNFGALNVGPTLNQVNYKTVGHMLGCSYMSSRDIVDCIRRKSEKEIMTSLELSFYQIPFAPVFDGDFVIADPQEMLNKNNTQYSDVQNMFSSTDMLIGGNSMEGAIYMTFLWKALLLQSNMENFRVSFKQFKEKVVPNVLKQIYGKELHDGAAEAVQMRYSDVTNPFDQIRIRDMLIKLSTDYVFTVPNLHTAVLHSDTLQSSTTYVYEFKAKTSLHIGKFRSPSWVKEANHGDELPFVFGFSRRMLKSFAVSDSIYPTPEELILSKKMMKLWTNFAKSGSPNTPDASTDCPSWPTFSTGTATYLELSTNMTSASLKNGYGEPGGTFWLHYMPSILDSESRETQVITCENAASGNAFKIKPDISKIVIGILSIIVALLVGGLIATWLCLRNKSKDRKTTYTYDTVEI